MILDEMEDAAMPYLVVPLTAFAVSMLTLFSGFGLGTLLLPAFALFFPLPVAVAATAVVHLANNLFKAALVGRKADWGVVLRFALPGAAASILGAALLGLFANQPPIWLYRLGSHSFEISLLDLVIGLIIIGFALFDLLPALNQLAFARRFLPLGGLLSGFFGGLSGNQGALRAAFLIKCGLDKDAFIGTSILSAVIVDLARLGVYGVNFYSTKFSTIPQGMGWLVLVATLAAFGGAVAGALLVKKVTLRAVQITVGILMMITGAGLAAGII
jgi:uncharacterized membrane protein YfcA